MRFRGIIVSFLLVTLQILRAGEATTVNSPDGTLNVRQTASPDGKVVATLNNGVPVLVMETVGEWCMVKLSDGSVGYVKAKYLGLSGAGAAGSATVTSEAAERTPSVSIAAGTWTTDDKGIDTPRLAFSDGEFTFDPFGLGADALLRGVDPDDEVQGMVRDHDLLVNGTPTYRVDIKSGVLTLKGAGKTYVFRYFTPSQGS